MQRTVLDRLRLALGAATMLLLFPGCHPDHGPGHDHAGHAHDHGGGHGHEEEGRTAQFTLWSGRHEVFAEHAYVVAGKPTEFITHITDLQTLEPRRAGPVRFELRQGNATLDHPQAAPARDGIYLPRITFPKPGAWQVTLVIPHDGAEDRVAFPPITAYASEDEVAKAPEPPEIDGISFLKEQQWKITFQTDPASLRTLAEHLQVPASVATRPGSVGAVTPPIAGHLHPPAGRPMPTLGERVEAGQTLAVVQPLFSEFAARLVEAEAEIKRSELALQQARLAGERTRQLADAGAKSTRELEEAVFTLKQAEARVEAARSLQATYRQLGRTMGLDGGDQAPVIALKAPIGGVIVRQTGAVGEYVPADRAVYTVLDTRVVHLEGRITETRLGRIHPDAPAHVTLAGDPNARWPVTGTGGGRLVFLGPEVDATTRTVPLVYELPNPDGRLRIGQLLTLHLRTGHVEGALVVPDSAIVEEAGQPVAYVQLGGETFERRELTLGIRDAEHVQVLAGLKEGERVVTRGAHAVRLASMSNALPGHGHAH
jgi:membrane fusion protein, heavy metal efflux system